MKALQSKKILFSISCVALLTITGFMLKRSNHIQQINWAEISYSLPELEPIIIEKDPNLFEGTREKQIGELRFSVLPIPYDKLKIPPTAQESSKEAGNAYFNFRIESLIGDDPLKANILHPYQKEERLQHYTFNAKREFFMEVDGEVIPCNYYLFESSHGIAPYINILLSFDFDLHQGTRATLVYNDSQYNLGKIKIRINPTTESLKN